jgi:uncharacterized protein YndB with AHSA1/START domain
MMMKCRRWRPFCDEAIGRHSARVRRSLTATIPASPDEIYQAWLDSIGHSEMTGSEARMSDEVGAEVSAWDGYISGRNLELIPGERIVQSWRTTEFGDEEEDSVITVVLQETEEGTLLTLDHSNVPDEHKGYEEGGWQSNYFEPMIAYFTELKEDIAEPAPRKAPPRSAPKKPGKRSAKSAGKKTAGKKTAGKARRAVGTRTSKRAAPRKASPNKKAAPKKSKGKSRAKARATTARTRAKSSARKAARGKRR